MKQAKIKLSLLTFMLTIFCGVLFSFTAEKVLAQVVSGVVTRSHCLPMRKSSDDARKKRIRAESAYNQSLRRYEILGQQIDRIILRAVNQINRIDGEIAGIYLALGVEATTVFTNRLTCGGSQAYQEFCNQNRGEFLRLARKYGALLGKRRAAMQILEATDRAQGARQRRVYGSALQRWAALSMSINIEMATSSVEDTCLKEMGKSTAAMNTALAAISSSNFCSLGAATAPTSPLSIEHPTSPFFGGLIKTAWDAVVQTASNFIGGIGGALNSAIQAFTNTVASAYRELTQKLFKQANDLIGSILGNKANLDDFYRNYVDEGKCPLPPSRPREMQRNGACVSWLGIADALGFSFCNNSIVRDAIQ